LGHGRRTSERWGRRHRPISCAISEPSRSPMATTGSVPLLPAVITAAIDLCGTVTAHAARALGVPDAPITTIAAQVDGITPTNGANAALEKLARLIATGRLRVPIAASFPVKQIRTAVEIQAGRHVKGKVVIDLQENRPAHLIRHSAALDSALK
jgi:hypothetical protein